jgi:hypothetical protein
MACVKPTIDEINIGTHGLRGMAVKEIIEPKRPSCNYTVETNHASSFHRSRAAVRGPLSWLPLLALAALCAVPAPAATYTVTNTTDTTSAGSLRWAITAANADSNPSDLINFNVSGTITLASALPPITRSNLTISGPGASLLAIDGGGTSSGFQRLLRCNRRGHFLLDDRERLRL